MITLPLDEMTTEEKMQLMELLWADLQNRADAVLSPEWHLELLNQRRAAVDSGEEVFVDWEEAKAAMRKELL